MYLEGIDLESLEDGSFEKISIANNLGCVKMLRKSNLKRAAELIKKAHDNLRLCRDKISMINSAIFTYNLALAYREEGELEKARQAAYQAAELNQQFLLLADNLFSKSPAHKIECMLTFVL